MNFFAGVRIFKPLMRLASVTIKRIFMDSLEVSQEKMPHRASTDALCEVESKISNPRLDDRIRLRILMRLMVIAALLGIRAVTAYFTPDLFIQSKVVGAQVDSSALYPANDLMQVRAMLLVIVLAGYLYSLIADRYFRFMTVFGMVVGCALLWSDMELFMLSSVSEITPVSFALLGMRLIVFWLLVLNYLDIHR